MLLSCVNLNIGIKSLARNLIEIFMNSEFFVGGRSKPMKLEGRRKDERKGNEGVFRGGPASGLISKVCALDVDTCATDKTKILKNAAMMLNFSGLEIDFSFFRQ